MFKKRNILIVLMATAILAACKDKNGPTAEEQSTLTFEASVAAPVAETKYAGGAAFDQNDEISLYALERTSEQATPIIQKTGNHFHNAQFVRGEYYFEHKDNGEGKLGFPTNGAMMDLFAHYPYRAAVPATLPVLEVQILADQTTQAKLVANDFLRSAKLKVKPQLQPVSLQFSHAMAKLVIMVSRAAKYETDGITVDEIRIKQLVTKSLYNIQDGTADIEATPLREDILPLVSTTTVDGKQLPTRTMIVAPQELVVDNIFVEIVMSNKKLHTLAFDNNSTVANRNLASGTQTEINVEVSPGATQAVVLNGTMTDWNTGDKISEIISQKNDTEFICNINSVTGNEATAKWAKVSVQNGVEAMRTYEVPVTYTAAGTPAKWTFAFPGVGNRPNKYPYTVKTVTFTNAAGTTIYTAALSTANVVSAAGQTITFTK